MRTPAYTFQNSRQQQTRVHADAPKTPEPYCADDKLKRAINLAIALERPLLLEGEAGCGKTRLARAIAYELGLPFYPWYVRSTSKAQEGFYTYDAMLRLHDVQLSQLQKPGGAAPRLRDPADPTQYRYLGPLGQAFALRPCPAVVLIDEIDKADLDFPNDLLAVLDAPWSFTIPETGETISAAHKPIVLITSNKEKGNLPAPFLRRCLYFYVEFPNETELKEIVAEHTPAGEKMDDALVSEAAHRFSTLRREAGLHKKPGTSEFLDWMQALCKFEARPWQAGDLTSASSLPYPELLFKLRTDWQRYGISQ